MSGLGWRIRLGSLAVALAAIAAAVIGLLSGGSPSAGAASASGPARAATQARGLLDRLALPAGAPVSTTRPPVSRSLGTAATGGLGTLGTLGTLGQATSPDTVSRTRRWTVGAPLASVRAVLLAQPPGGTRARELAPDSLSFRVRRPPAGLSAAGVEVMLRASGPRSTAVLADAAATWVLARPADERVPANARDLVITRGTPGRRPGIELRITDPARVARIAELVNRLPIVQPGVFHCPIQVAGLPVVRFTFRAADGTLLAQASEDADVVVPSTACDPLHFSVSGQPPIGLLGGAALLREVSRLQGVGLWLPPYAA